MHVPPLQILFVLYMHPSAKNTDINYYSVHISLIFYAIYDIIAITQAGDICRPFFIAHVLDVGFLL